MIAIGKIFLKDRADGVQGRCCLARIKDSQGTHEYWNKGKWCAFGEIVFDTPKPINCHHLFVPGLAYDYCDKCGMPESDNRREIVGSYTMTKEQLKETIEDAYLQGMSDAAKLLLEFVERHKKSTNQIEGDS